MFQGRARRGKRLVIGGAAEATVARASKKGTKRLQRMGEIYYVPLTRQYLEAHRKSGITIWLKGANGAVVAVEPSSFVTNFWLILMRLRKGWRQIRCRRI